MDNLGDLLSKRDLNEPPDIKLIKDFVKENFEASVSVKLQRNQIIIVVNSAALAASLRMRLHEIQKLMAEPKRLVIYIN